MAPELVVSLVVALAGTPGDPFQEGVRLYEQGRFAESVEALTQALASGYPKKTLARVHVYIGLIQFRFDHQDDARRSFAEALRLSPKVQLPQRSPAKARQMFLSIKKQRAIKRAPRVAPSKAPEAADEQIASVPPPPPPEVPPPPPPPLMTAVSAPPAKLVIEEPAPIAASGWEIAGWTFVGVGGAAIVSGGVFFGMAVSSRNAALSESVAVESERLHGEAIERRNVGIGVTSAGVALIAAGAIMLLASDHQ